ncbi:hypothetical protein P7C70_g4027, partial [Phenoliferia sp. Uapishka_3]
MNTIQGAWNTLSGSEHAQAASAMVEQDSSMFAFLNLTRTQRFYGFGACLLGGFTLSLIGAIFFTFGQIALFATLYVLGVVLSLVGTGFLIGTPRHQGFRSRFGKQANFKSSKGYFLGTDKSRTCGWEYKTARRREAVVSSRSSRLVDEGVPESHGLARAIHLKMKTYFERSWGSAAKSGP